MARILVAEDEPGLLAFVADALEGDGHIVTRAVDGEVASQLLEQSAFELLVTDLKMPKVDGMTLLRKVRAEQPEVEVIVMTAHGSIETAVEAIKLGAHDYLTKPVSGPRELRLIVARALERRQLLERKTSDERGRPDLPALSYADPAMDEVVRALDKAAPTSSTVLLLGESGTGKEVAARRLHALSQRSDSPFVAINCAALPETLIESELFGHEKGAFTGARERRRGCIELAHGGTFFLDEVSELRTDLQAKLLRVIEQGELQRVGGSQLIQVDVRWIAATNRDLAARIEEGAFREDLYHRLAVFPVRLPPLRDRADDILPIAELLLSRICATAGKRRLRLTDAAARRLVAWHWPGNIRELRNTLERAAIVTDSDTIAPEHLWLEASSAGATSQPSTLADLEREAIRQALLATGGNRRQAAEQLGIAERTLYDKLRRYDLT